MKIATWNVNSLRVRLPQVLDWLRQQQPDVLCVQETKSVDENFPAKEINDAGYQVVFTGQKTYNGVAILSKAVADGVILNLPGSDDPQRRVVTASFDGIRVINVYVPNGSEVGSDKYAYKLEWLERLTDFVSAQLETHAHVVLLGDFNIAPQDRDVHDPVAWQGKVLCSEAEREAFQRLLSHGMADCFRKFEQEPGLYSWWDYRAAGFRRNRGLRIDHVVASPTLYAACTSCTIDKAPRKHERPSDHTPVVAEFTL